MPSSTYFIFIIFTFWLIVLGWYDYYEHRLPNVLTLGGIVVFFVIRICTGGKGGLIDALCGGFIGFFFLLIPFILHGAGAGDIKMLTAVGILVGYPLILHVLTLCSIIGMAMGIYLYLTKHIMTSRLYHWAKCCFNRHEENEEVSPAPNNTPVEIRFGLAIALGTWLSIVYNLLH